MVIPSSRSQRTCTLCPRWKARKQHSGAFHLLVPTAHIRFDKTRLIDPFFRILLYRGHSLIGLAPFRLLVLQLGLHSLDQYGLALDEFQSLLFRCAASLGILGLQVAERTFCHV